MRGVRVCVLLNNGKEEKALIYLELLWTFFKIGAFTFGGGYAMLPLIQDEVTARGWVSERALVDFIAVSESTPGPFAVNISTYVGFEVGGLLGAFCATFGVVLPSFIVILIVAKCFVKFKNSTVVKGCMSGLKPAVVGLIGASLVSIGSMVFVPSGVISDIKMDPAFAAQISALALLIVLAFKKVHPILIICLSAALGIIFGYLPI